MPNKRDPFVRQFLPQTIGVIATSVFVLMLLSDLCRSNGASQARAGSAPPLDRGQYITIGRGKEQNQRGSFKLGPGIGSSPATIYSLSEINPFGNKVQSDIWVHDINTSGQAVGEAAGTFELPNGEFWFFRHAFLYDNGVTHDLGTLFGRPPSSFDDSVAVAINDSGQIVGISGDTAAMQNHGFIYSGGAMQDLGVDVIPTGINASGQIVGSFATANSHHAFLYSGGVMHDLGLLPGSTTPNCPSYSEAYDINDSGQVVGVSASPNCGVDHGFLYSGGVMHDLGVNVWPRSINASGQVVGVHYPIPGQPRAFLYTGGVLKDLMNNFSQASDINDLGQVVGTFASPFPFDGDHPFIYSGGVLTDLNTLIPADSGWTLQSRPADVVAINNSGQVVGQGNDPLTPYRNFGAIDVYLLTPMATPTPTPAPSPSPSPSPTLAEVTGLTDFTLTPSTAASSSSKTYKFSVVDSVTRTPVPGATVNLQFSIQPLSGGHDHDDSSRPVYGLGSTTTVASATGNFDALYVAPLVSGKVQIKIECSVQGRQCNAGTVNIDVKVSNLQELGPNVTYLLTGATNTHMSNHFGVLALNAALVGLANDYAAKFNGDKLSYNDMSLVWGGLFDCNTDCGGTFWNPPHKGHNSGLNVDVGLVTPTRRSQLIQMAWSNNLGVLVEGNHWHLTYGKRGYCKILNGRYCSPTNPPLNSGSARIAPSNFAAASGLTIQVTPQVTHSSQTGLYTYQYSVRNDTRSSLEMSAFQVLLGNAVVFNLQAPQGWTASLWNDTSTVAFAATDVGSLPPNVDDGNLVPSPYQIKPGQTLDGFSFQSPYAPGTVDLLAQGFNKIPDFVSEDDTQQPELFDGAFTGTTSGPAPIQLVMEESSAQPTQVTALDSVLFLRDPFPVINGANFLNLGLDRNTRVVVFVKNLQLAQGETSPSVLVNLIGSNGNRYDVTAEDVRPVPNFDFTQVIFRLPDGLAVGTCTVTIRAHGHFSNLGTIRIRI